jgi:hypothetical protein
MFAATRSRLVDGAVVLAHDGIGPGALRDSAQETIGFAAMAIEHANRAGLALRPLA